MSVAGYRAEVIQSLGASEFFAASSGTSTYASATPNASLQFSIPHDPTTEQAGKYDAWPAETRLEVDYDFANWVDASTPYPLGYSRIWEYNSATTSTPAAAGEYSFGSDRDWSTATAATSISLWDEDANGFDRSGTIPAGSLLRYVSPENLKILFRITAASETSNVITLTVVPILWDPGSSIPSGTESAQFQWIDNARSSEYRGFSSGSLGLSAGQYIIQDGSTRQALGAVDSDTDRILVYPTTADASFLDGLVAGDYIIAVAGENWVALRVNTAPAGDDNRTVMVDFLKKYTAGTGTISATNNRLIFIKQGLFDSQDHGSFPYVEVNRLFGWLTVFGSDTNARLRFKGSYLPKKLLAGANSFTLSMSNEMLDDTDFGSKGWVSRVVGLHNAGLSISRYAQESSDFRDILLENHEADVLVEITPVSDRANNPVGRGYFKIGSADRAGDVNALETHDLEYELNVFEDAETQRFAGFIWSDED